MAGPKSEGGRCTICKKQLGYGTKHPCFYQTKRENGMIVWHMLCREHKLEYLQQQRAV